MTYGRLAEVYDAFAYDFDREAWTDTYVSLLAQNAADIKEICDCGCGTGALTIPLAQRGYRVIGADLSGDMLRVASDKARRAGVMIPFIRQDMCALKLTHPVDAVMCACDGVNYLTRPAQVLAFFKSAFAALKPGGALAFDVSSPGKLRRMGEDRLFAEDGADMSYIWFTRFDDQARLACMELSFFVKQLGGAYEKFHESHVQRAWEQEELLALIRESGFQNVSARGDDDGSERVYFSAGKPNA
ncbi:MAG: class I SAM-dependent methyltransferase [Clostridia bacterium]|nr:class I SAM-dependent methyltransferase [Clostridia bacterium]